MIPVPKILKAKKPSDYRPISLTSILSKLAESFVKDSITTIVTGLDPNQFGFLPKKCTTDALILAQHRWAKAIGNKNGYEDFIC